MEDKEELRRICSLKYRLIEIAEQEAALDIKSIDYKGLGEVIDMIKDLCGAIKDCHEAKYYESVVEAMEEYEEENERMGYDAYRYSNGRYAPKGQGHRSPVTHRGGKMGYVPPMMQDPRHDGMDWPMDEHDMRAHPQRYYHGSDYDDESTMLHDVRAMLSNASPELKKRIKSEISDI